MSRLMIVLALPPFLVAPQKGMLIRLQGLLALLVGDTVTATAYATVVIQWRLREIG